MKYRVIRFCALMAAAALVPACGSGGGKGAAAPATAADTPPSITVFTPAGIQSGVLSIGYRLSDADASPCSLQVAVSGDGGVTWSPAAAGPGGDGVAALSSSPGVGTVHTFVWDSAANGLGLVALATVRLRLTPSDAAAGTPGVTADFPLINRAFTAPSITIVPPAGPLSGNISLSYSLSDAESDPCALQAEYSTDGVSFLPATLGPGGDGVAGLASSPGGTAHVFVWNSIADGIALTPAPVLVRIRLTPSDGAPGVGATTADFSVSNRSFTVPTATITTPSGVQAGNIPLAYSLSDAEGDACSVEVRFSLDGGATFFAASAGPGGDGTSGLAAAPGGSPHTFVWNSALNGVATGLTPASVIVRILPSDPSVGVAATSGAFTVNNRPYTAPSATITTPAGPQSGLVAISYRLVDAEGDPCSVLLQFSVDGGSSFATASPGPGGDGLVGLAASPGSGSAHLFLWNSVADGVGTSTARFRVTPNDGSPGAAATSGDFSVDNAGAGPGTALTGFPVLVDGTPKADWARSIASDGPSIYVFGFDGLDLASGTDASWRLEKRSASTGATDGSFPPLLLNPGPGLDLPVKVLVDGAFVYLLGVRDLGAGAFSVQLRKLNASDGSPVAAFGSAGVLEGPAAAAGDGIPLVWTAALDDAALYLAGPEALSATQSRWRVEKRDKTSGGLVGGFGSSGVVVAAAHGLIDACFALVLDGSSMWIAGTQDADAGVSSNSKIRIEKRSLSTGALVPGFGTGGLLTIDAGPGDDLAEDAVRDGSFLYVYSRVETGFGTGIFSARLDKLSLADGASAATLSGLGGLDPTGELPCRHLALDGGDLFVAGADQSGDPRWRLEKRRASDLSVNTAFAGSGVLLLNPSGGDDRPLDLLVRGGVVYVVGTDASAGGGRWRIEARWK